MKYPYIDKKIWEDFVKFRITPYFLAKSQKGKENRAKNIYPYRLSRGGYDKLEEKMINEKRKQRELELGDPSRSLDHNSSPPSRHKKWKMTC